MLHALDEDANHCCKRKFLKAAGKGELDGKESWTCDRCGCEYHARLGDGLAQWTYYSPIAILRHAAR